MRKKAITLLQGDQYSLLVQDPTMKYKRKLIRLLLREELCLFFLQAARFHLFMVGQKSTNLTSPFALLFLLLVLLATTCPSF